MLVASTTLRTPGGGRRKACRWSLRARGGGRGKEQAVRALRALAAGGDRVPPLRDSAVPCTIMQYHAPGCTHLGETVECRGMTQAEASRKRHEAVSLSCISWISPMPAQRGTA